MNAMASQITSLTIVYSIVYSGADQKTHQSSSLLAGDRRIPLTKGQYPGKCFHLWTSSCSGQSQHHGHINPYNAKSGLFQKKYVNTMAANALAPSIPNPSAAMVFVT